MMERLENRSQGQDTGDTSVQHMQTKNKVPHMQPTKWCNTTIFVVSDSLNADWVLNYMFLSVCVLPYFVGLFSSFPLVALCPFCWLAPSWGCGWAAGWVAPEAAADDSDSLPELALVCALRSSKVKANKNMMWRAHHQDLHAYCYNNFVGVCQKSCSKYHSV